MISRRAPFLILALALSLGACDSFDEGIVLEVFSKNAMSTGAHGSHEHVKIEAIEIVECPSMLGKWWSVVAIPTAHAHTFATPTRIDLHHRIDLAQTPIDPIKLGELHPPPGDYCGLKIALETGERYFDFTNEEGAPAALVLSEDARHAKLTYEVQKAGNDFSVTAHVEPDPR